MQHLKKMDAEERLVVVIAGLAFAPGMKTSAETLVVNDFGAKDDGVAVDMAAVQCALDKGAGKHTTIAFRPEGR